MAWQILEICQVYFSENTFSTLYSQRKLEPKNMLICLNHIRFVDVTISLLAGDETRHSGRTGV